MLGVLTIERDASKSIPFLPPGDLEVWKETNCDAHTRGGSRAFEQAPSSPTHALYVTMTITGRVFLAGVSTYILIGIH